MIFFFVNKECLQSMSITITILILIDNTFQLLTHVVVVNMYLASGSTVHGRWSGNLTGHNIRMTYKRLLHFLRIVLQMVEGGINTKMVRHMLGVTLDIIAFCVSLARVQFESSPLQFNVASNRLDVNFNTLQLDLKRSRSS